MTDNKLKNIYLNGVSQGFEYDGAGWSPDFVLDRGFNSGRNKLVFEWENIPAEQPNPSGLRTRIGGTAVPLYGASAGSSIHMVTSAAKVMVPEGLDVVWYSITAPSSSSLQVDTLASPSDLDTEIGVYREDGTLIVTNDDTNGGGYLSSLVIPGLIGGRTYFIAVGLYNTNFGLTNFDVTVDADNDAQTGRMLLSVLLLPSSSTILAPICSDAWTQIAQEGETYTFLDGDRVDLAFGTVDQITLNYIYYVVGTFTFDVATFGDPAPGIDKVGFFRCPPPAG